MDDSLSVVEKYLLFLFIYMYWKFVLTGFYFSCGLLHMLLTRFISCLFVCSDTLTSLKGARSLKESSGKEREEERFEKVAFNDIAVFRST